MLISLYIVILFEESLMILRHQLLKMIFSPLIIVNLVVYMDSG